VVHQCQGSIREHQWPASLETPSEPLVTSYAVQISNRIDPEESYL
jgi:hypothetical protein